MLELAANAAAADDFLDFLLREVKQSERMQRIETMNKPTPIPITSHTFRPNMLVFFDSSWFRSLPMASFSRFLSMGRKKFSLF